MNKPHLLSQKPANGGATLSDGVELYRRGRLAEAAAAFAALLATQPANVDALQMMGLVELARGDAASALRHFVEALKTRPGAPQLLANQGLALAAQGRNDDALASFDQALKSKAKFPEALNGRGSVLAAMGRLDDALQSYDRALSAKGDYAEAHFNRANALRQLGRFADALAAYDKALAIRPDYAKAHNNRGTALDALGRTEHALASYERALALRPDFVEALNNRGNALRALGRTADALASYERALALRPNYADALYSRGRALQVMNRTGEAIAAFEAALAARPGYMQAAFALPFAELPILYSEDSEVDTQRQAYERRLHGLLVDIQSGRLDGRLHEGVGPNQPFYLAYQGKDDRALNEAYGSLVCSIMAARFPRAGIAGAPAPGEKIRIGIVSGFFRSHANWRIPIKGWLEGLDRDRFRLFGYYTGTLRDAQTEIASALCERFVEGNHPVERWRRKILADAPHVLIYPAIYMDQLSAQLAAQRLAPVQCNSWGHPDTSGMPTVDYYLSSDLMEPPEADAFYSERLVRLPNLSVSYEPPPIETVAVARAELGIRDSAVAFWCGQSIYKYLPRYDEVFPRIAREVPDSQFVFIGHQKGDAVTTLFRERLERAYARHGLVAADHCVILPRLDGSRFVAAIGACDAVLDSIGWSGCNSTLESLAHDLPVVTTPGAFMRGRHTAAILQMMGVTDTIAPDLDAFVRTAVRLAHEPEWRAALRAQITASKHRLWRDPAPVVALGQFIEEAVRRAVAQTTPH